MSELTAADLDNWTAYLDGLDTEDARANWGGSDEIPVTMDMAEARQFVILARAGLASRVEFERSAELQAELMRLYAIFRNVSGALANLNP